jgi:hypothetical protein
MLRRTPVLASLAAIAATTVAFVAPATAQEADAPAVDTSAADAELAAAAAPSIYRAQMLTTTVDPGTTWAAGQIRVWVRDDGALRVNVPARAAEPPINGYQVCARVQGDTSEPQGDAFGECVGWLRAGTVSAQGTDAVFDVPIKVLVGSPGGTPGVKNVEITVKDAAGEVATSVVSNAFTVGPIAGNGQTLNFYHLQNESTPGNPFPNLAWVGSTKATLTYTRNGGAIPTSPDINVAGGPYRYTGFVVDAPVGTNVFRAGGDTTGVTLISEATLAAPTVSIASGIPANGTFAAGANVSINLAINAGETATAYWYKLNTGDWTLASGAALNLGALANGTYNLSVAVNDGAGFTSGVVTRTFVVGTPGTPPPPPPAAGTVGYLIAAQSGNVVNFGSSSTLPRNGTATHTGNVVDIAYNPARTGYWTLDQNGRVVAYGAASVQGGATSNIEQPGWRSGESAVALSPTSSGDGYWVFTSAGRVLRFGDAGALPDLLTVPLQKPVVDAAPAVGGGGVYLVAEDGGVFALNAQFYGSVPGAIGRLPNRPVRAILPQAGGYLMVAEDGGVFSFGNTTFRGSLPGLNVVPNRPISGMVTSGQGYLLVGEDGGVFAFGTTFSGSLGATGSASRVVGIAAR